MKGRSEQGLSDVWPQEMLTASVAPFLPPDKPKAVHVLEAIRRT